MDSRISVLVGFGSNLGDSAHIYQQVGQLLSVEESISEVRLSTLVSTQPIGGPEGQPIYRNGAIGFMLDVTEENEAEQCSTEANELAGERVTMERANRLHALLRAIESEFGRERKERWGSRKIDLDLLLFGKALFETTELTVPHPRMSFRRFVVEPAAEIASQMIHPESGLRIDELLERLNRKVPKVGITGAVEACKDVLQDLQEKNVGFQFELRPGPPDLGKWTGELTLLIHLLVGREDPRLSSTNAPTLQALVEDRSRLAVEVQAALDGVLPFEISPE